MIIRRSLFVFAKVVVSRRPQKVRHRYLGKKFSPRVQCFDGERVVLIFISGKGKVAISFGKIRLEFHRREEFILRLRKLLPPQQSLAQAAMKFGITRRSGNKGTIGGLS